MAESTEHAARYSHHTFVLIVGISDYRAKGLDDLPACAPEAQQLEEILLDPKGCAIPAANVTRLSKDVTTLQIVEALSRLTRDRTVNDTLVVYLAGHGDVRGGQFVFLTGSADTGSGLTSSELDIALASVPLRGVLLIVDCCSSADLAKHAPSFFQTPEGGEFRLFLSATRGRQSSWEFTEARRSLFTTRLLKALRGDVVLGRPGEIYYSDLYEYLHTAVQEDAKRLLGTGAAQEPISIGSQGGNPLLFLHRDLSPSAVRVKTPRVTREDLHRRVRLAVMAVLLCASVATAAYWSFLDGHQYLLAESTIAVVHGYPQWSGFGLPKEEWRFPFTRDAILPSHPLAANSFVLRRGDSAPEALATALHPGPRALLRVWQGRANDARDILLDANTALPWGPHGLWALKSISFDGHEADVQQLIPKLPPDESIALTQALAATDPDSALQAFLKSPASAQFGHELNLLAAWSTPCTPATQAWLDSFLHRQRLELLMTVATTAVITGCTFSEDWLYKRIERSEDVITALRLTDPKRAASLEKQMHEAIEKLTGPAKEPSVLALVGLAAGPYLESVPCIHPDPMLRELGEPDRAELEGRTIALLLSTRGCNDPISLRWQAARSEYGDDKVIISTVKGHIVVDYVQLGLRRPVRADVLGPVDVLVEAAPEAAKQLIEGILKTSPGAELRAALIQRLAYLRYRAPNPLDWRLPAQPMLDRAIVQLVAQHDPDAASGLLREFLAQPDGTQIETLALVPLNDADRAAVQGAAELYEPLARTIALTLIGTPQTAAQLLGDARPEVRAWAADYAPLREDWDLVSSLAQKQASYPDGALLRAQALRHDIAQISQWFERTPSWARPWLVSKLERHRANSSAEQLHLARLRQAHRLPP